MSRVGKKPVLVPDNVKISITGRNVSVENGQQRLTMMHRPEVAVRLDQDLQAVVVDRKGNGRTARAMHGLTRALIANMVAGVCKPFAKELLINGVGWTAKVDGDMLALNVGYADTRVLSVPPELSVQVNRNRISVSGADKQLVGQFAADVRRQRPPEPYSGKGIQYTDEKIIRKQGKAFAGSGAG